MSKQNKKKRKPQNKKTQPVTHQLPGSNLTTSKQVLETTNHQQSPDKVNTQESPPPLPQTPMEIPKVEADSNLQLDVLYEYMCSQWNTRTVTATIRNLTTSCTAVCPPQVLWNTPQNLEIGGLVYGIMCNKKWLANLWPTLYLMMKPNIGNLAWTSMVVCGFAYYGFLLCLPANIKLQTKPQGGK